MLTLPFSPAVSVQVLPAEASLTDLSRDGAAGIPNENTKPLPVLPEVPPKKQHPTTMSWGVVLALPIFPGRLQPSIVSRSELNFRVRDGNGWTLALISTNYEVYCTFKTEQCIIENQEGLLPA